MGDGYSKVRSVEFNIEERDCEMKHVLELIFSWNFNQSMPGMDFCENFKFFTQV